MQPLLTEQGISHHLADLFTVGSDLGKQRFDLLTVETGLRL